jgi:hypothetical protein
MRSGGVASSDRRDPGRKTFARSNSSVPAPYDRTGQSFAGLRTDGDPPRSSSSDSRSYRIFAAAATNSEPKLPGACGSPPRSPNSPKRSEPGAVSAAGRPLTGQRISALPVEVVRPVCDHHVSDRSAVNRQLVRTRRPPGQFDLRPDGGSHFVDQPQHAADPGRWLGRERRGERVCYPGSEVRRHRGQPGRRRVGCRLRRSWRRFG